MTNEQYQTILRAIEGLGAMQADTLTKQAKMTDELKNLRGDVQQAKTSQRADRKRDWRIIKMLKGGR